jgi:hypothetical protein
MSSADLMAFAATIKSLAGANEIMKVVVARNLEL